MKNNWQALKELAVHDKCKWYTANRYISLSHTNTTLVQWWAVDVTMDADGGVPAYVTTHTLMQAAMAVLDQHHSFTEQELIG